VANGGGESWSQKDVCRLPNMSGELEIADDYDGWSMNIRVIYKPRPPIAGTNFYC
jgi:hypothetical protein